MLLSAPLFLILSDILYELLWCNADCHIALFNTPIRCLSRLMLEKSFSYSHKKRTVYSVQEQLNWGMFIRIRKVSVHAEAQQGRNSATYDRGRRRVEYHCLERQASEPVVTLSNRPRLKHNSSRKLRDDRIFFKKNCPCRVGWDTEKRQHNWFCDCNSCNYRGRRSCRSMVYVIIIMVNSYNEKPSMVVNMFCCWREEIKKEVRSAIRSYGDQW